VGTCRREDESMQIGFVNNVGVLGVIEVDADALPV
jgi:hypothetical protein